MSKTTGLGPKGSGGATPPKTSPPSGKATATPPKGSVMTSTMKVPFMPEKPKFGDVTEVGTDTWAAWTGGRPKADWSELEDTQPLSIDPNQYRSTSISSQAKSQYYRTKGFEVKFTRDSDLQTFQKKTLEHLEQYGLDTITHLQDPTDEEKGHLGNYRPC